MNARRSRPRVLKLRLRRSGGSGRRPGEVRRKLRRRLRPRLGARGSFGEGRREKGDGAPDDEAGLCARIGQRQIVAAADVARSRRAHRRPGLPFDDCGSGGALRLPRAVMFPVVSERVRWRETDQQCRKKEKQRPHAGDSSAGSRGKSRPAGYRHQSRPRRP